MTTCPACQHEIQSGQQACPHCGAIISKWHGHVTGTSSFPPATRPAAVAQLKSSAWVWKPLKYILFVAFVVVILWSTSFIGLRQVMVFVVMALLMFCGSLLLWSHVAPKEYLGNVKIFAALLIGQQAILLGLLAYDVHDKTSNPIGPFCRHWDIGQNIEGVRIEAKRVSLRFPIEYPHNPYFEVGHESKWAECWCDIRKDINGQILEKPRPYCISPSDYIIGFLADLRCYRSGCGNSPRMKYKRDYRTLEMVAP